jgi:hypothetical protein
MVREGWADIEEGVPVVVEVTVVLMGWVPLIIKMETGICVAKNRNKYRMFLSHLRWQG